MNTATGERREVVEEADGLRLTQLPTGERTSVRYLRIDPGGRVPKHSPPHEQAGYATQCVLTLVVGDRASVPVDGERVGCGEQRADADDAYLIPPGQPHAAVNRSDGLVEGVDVFAPSSTAPDWQ